MNTTTYICNFCPVQCICAITTLYVINACKVHPLVNSCSCTPNFVNSTTQIALDLNNTSISQRTTYGFRFNNTGSTFVLANYFVYCGNKMSHQGMLGRYAFRYNSVVYKTYYGLPYHQWASIKFQFFILDNWQT